MGFLNDVVCFAWKGSPMFWQAYIVIRVARSQGASEQDARNAVKGAAGAGYGLTGLEAVAGLTESCGNCAVDAVYSHDLAPVILFQHDDFAGDTQECDEGEYRADRGELDDVGNDELSSLVVAPGYKVFIAENEPENGLGQNRWLEAGSYPNFRFTGIFPNDTVSYVKVVKA